MAIIGMLQKTLAEIIKSMIMIEKMTIKKKNIVRYFQDSNNEESKDSYEEEKWISKKKETKDHSKTIIRGVYCQNCYNEGHLTKECKLLNKFCQICK
jgi:hypothetical protein